MIAWTVLLSVAKGAFQLWQSQCSCIIDIMLTFGCVVLLRAVAWLQLLHTYWRRRSGILEPACLLHVSSPSVS